MFDEFDVGAFLA